MSLCGEEGSLAHNVTLSIKAQLKYELRGENIL